MTLDVMVLREVDAKGSRLSVKVIDLLNNKTVSPSSIKSYSWFRRRGNSPSEPVITRDLLWNDVSTSVVSEDGELATGETFNCIFAPNRLCQVEDEFSCAVVLKEEIEYVEG